MSANDIRSRDGLPFNFEDGLKVRGNLLSGVKGAAEIGYTLKDTDTEVLILLDWIRKVDGALGAGGATGEVATQALDDVSRKIANTEFVQKLLAKKLLELVPSSTPANLSDLAKVATSLGNDPKLKETLIALIDKKASLEDVRNAMGRFQINEGSADDLRASFTPEVTTLVDGMQLYVRAKLANSGAVTFTPNSSKITKAAVVKGSGAPLVAEDIAGPGHLLHLSYQQSTNSWVLLNPAKPISFPTATPAQIRDQTATDVLVTPAGLKLALDAVIGQVPAGMETLAKVSAAINNDANYHKNLLTLLEKLAPKEDAALTGSPTAPTAGLNVIGDQIATTKWVTLYLQEALKSVSISDATILVKGVVRLATISETLELSSESLAVTPKGLGAWWAQLKLATTSTPGPVRMADDEQTYDGVSRELAISPAGLKFAIESAFSQFLGGQSLPTSPGMVGASSIVVGLVYSLQLSATATTSGATIASFDVSVNGGAVQTLAATNGSATFNWTSSGAVGSTAIITATSKDSNGKVSTASTKSVLLSTVTVNAPVLSAPTSGQTNVSRTPVLTASTISATGGSVTLAQCEWEVRTAPAGGGTLKWSGSTTGAGAYSVTVPAASILDPGVVYYARHRQVSTAYGASAWVENSFTTVAVPSVPTLSGASTALTGQVYALSMSATAQASGASITAFEVSINGGAAQVVNATNGAATFNWTATGAAGAKATFSVRARDSNQSLSVAATREVTLATVTVNAPSFISPTSGATGVSISPLLRISPLSLSGGGTPNHASTDWEVRTAAAGGGVVKVSSLANVTAKEQLQLSLGALDAATNYWLRARVRDATYGESAWSEVAFTTANQSSGPTVAIDPGFVPGQSLSVALSATVVSPATSISSFAVSVNGGAEVVVTASSNAATYTIAASVTNAVAAGSTLSVSVRSLDNTGAYSTATVKTSTAVRVNAPSVTAPASGASNVSITPTFTTAALSVTGGTDTLKNTSWEVLTTAGVSVWSSLDDATNRLSITVPAGRLSDSTSYRLRVSHRGNVYGASAVTEVTFTTAAKATGPNLSGAASAFRGSDYVLTISGTAASPATAITKYEVSVDGVVKTELNATLVSGAYTATYTWPSTDTAAKAAGSAALFSVVAIDNTTSRSNASTRSVTVNGVSVLAPTVVSPVAASTSVSRTPTLSTQAFAVSGGSDTHLGTKWKITRVSDGVVLWDSGLDTTNKTSIAVPSGRLPGGVPLELSVIHVGTSNGDSPETKVTFTTVAEAAPVLSGADTWYKSASYNLSVAATVTAPATSVSKVSYSLNGGASTTVDAAGTTTPIVLPASLVSALAADSALTLRVTFTNSATGVSEVATKSLTLRNPVISTPVVSAPTSEQSGVVANPTLSTQAFTVTGGTATHKATSWKITEFGSATTVWSSLNDATNKLSVAVPAGQLKAGTRYTLTVIHHSNEFGDSQAASVNFTVKAAVAGPTLKGSTWGVLAGSALDFLIAAAPVAPATSIASVQYWFDSGAATTTTTKSGADWTAQLNASLTTGKAAGTAIVVSARTQDNTGAWSQVSTRTIRVGNVTRPSITSPASNATSVSTQPTLISSAFSVVSDADTHAKSDWVITTVKPYSEGGTVAVSKLDSTSDLTQFTVAAANALTPGQVYFLQNRHHGNVYGPSDWSAAISITVGSLAAPSVSNPANGATGVSKTVTLATSAFASPVSGDTHTKTDWELWSAAGRTGTLVWSSLNDATNKTSIAVPSGALADNTVYYLAVRYHSTQLGAGAYAEASFRTAGELAITQIRKMTAVNASLAAASYNGDGYGTSVAIAKTVGVNSARYGASSPYYDYFDGSVTDSGLADFGTIALTAVVTVINRAVYTGQSNPGELFGMCCAISGNLSKHAVGWPLNTTGGYAFYNHGSARLYNFNGSAMSVPSGAAGGSFLVMSDMKGYQYYANDIKMSADGLTVAVACYRLDSGGDNTGGVFIYTFNSATGLYEQQAVLKPTTVDSDEFGNAIDLSDDGNTLVVGSAMADTATGYDGGCAYVFRRSGTTWTQRAKIIPSEAVNSSYFGVSVAVSGDGSTVAIGSPRLDNAQSDSGAVHIFVTSDSGVTWTQQARLAAPDDQAAALFGMAVALSTTGNKLLTGAPGVTVSSLANAGRAYAHIRSGTTWTLKGSLSPTTPLASAQFGYSVDITGEGNHGIVGAPGGASVAGAAYIFQI